jgi:hypothetical protein
MNKQKMLIPKNKLLEYNFDELKNEYVHINKEKTIKIDDVISAVITTTGYNNQSYSCFGSIV